MALESADACRSSSHPNHHPTDPPGLGSAPLTCHGALTFSLTPASSPPAIMMGSWRLRMTELGAMGGRKADEPTRPARRIRLRKTLLILLDCGSAGGTVGVTGGVRGRERRAAWKERRARAGIGVGAGYVGSSTGVDQVGSPPFSGAGGQVGVLREKEGVGVAGMPADRMTAVLTGGCHGTSRHGRPSASPSCLRLPSDFSTAMRLEGATMSTDISAEPPPRVGSGHADRESQGWVGGKSGDDPAIFTPLPASLIHV